MKDNRQKKLTISNELLNAMLVGVKTREDLWGKDGIITQINKALLEHNGYGKKTLKSNFGLMELSTPRDRHSTFEPQIIPKRHDHKGYSGYFTGFVSRRSISLPDLKSYRCCK